MANCSFEAHRKSLLWPWPLVKESIWNFGGVAAFAGCEREPWKPQESHCCGSGVPAGDGVWRVWRVLEGLERLESFRGFAGWQTAALKAHRKPLLWPGPGVPVGESWGCSFCGLANGSFESRKKVIAVDLGCLLGTVFGGFSGFWRVWSVWRVLERLPAGIGVPVGECLLGKWLWPWPWGACWGSGLGPRVHVGEGVWNFGSLDLLQAGKLQLWGS